MRFGDVSRGTRVGVVGLLSELFGMVSECAVPFPLLVVVRVGVSRETWRVAVGVGKRGAVFHVKRTFGG